LTGSAVVAIFVIGLLVVVVLVVLVCSSLASSSSVLGAWDTAVVVEVEGVLLANTAVARLGLLPFPVVVDSSFVTGDLLLVLLLLFVVILEGALFFRCCNEGPCCRFVEEEEYVFLYGFSGGGDLCFSFVDEETDAWWCSNESFGFGFGFVCGFGFLFFVDWLVLDAVGGWWCRCC
jgi:hypothetical protein